MTDQSRLLPWLLCVFALTGCLETRESQKEVDEKQVMRRQVQTLQQNTADQSTRFQDLEDEQRKLNGKIQEVDMKVRQTNGLIDKGFGMADAKFKEKDEAYREEFTKLRAELEGLKAQIATLKTELEENNRESKRSAQARPEPSAPKAKEGDKNTFPAAEEKFEKKNWREAILDYEKYRKNFPRGRQFAAATYKIGASFEAMGLNDDARAFYEEVVSKFPKSKEAKSASTKLKKLK